MLLSLKFEPRRRNSLDCESAQTTRLTKHPRLCEAKENAEMSFSCSNLLQSPSFARGGALHASSSSKTHKSKAAFAVRAADDGTYFIVKPIHYAQFFRCIASKSAKKRCRRRKNERILRKRVFRPARRRRRERRAEVASMGFPRVCENDFLYLSRRGEKTSKEDNLLWYRGRKKEGPPPAPEKKDLFIRSTRRGGAVYLFSERIQ